MKKLIVSSILLLATLTVWAQGTPASVQQAGNGTVSISASGVDVRGVLHDLFTQAKKNYVCDPFATFVLHLSLTGVEFEEALQIVCKVAGLEYEVQNGIYFVSRKTASSSQKASSEVKATQPIAKPKGKLPETALDKMVTVRLAKTDLKAVFAEFGKQSQTTVEVAPGVPSYKIDAYLINTSLRYALDMVTNATALKYRFTDHLTIEIYKPAPQNSVKISGG